MEQAERNHRRRRWFREWALQIKKTWNQLFTEIFETCIGFLVCAKVVSKEFKGVLYQ